MAALVDIVMLNASVYHEPIVDPTGKQLMRKVEYFDTFIEVPAVRPVYLHEGTVAVPQDIADIFIGNGSAAYPTMTTTLDASAQAAASRKAAKVDTSLQ